MSLLVISLVLTMMNVLVLIFRCFTPALNPQPTIDPSERTSH